MLFFMTRIDKNLSFFKKNYWVILGFVWLALAIGMFFTTDAVEVGWNRNFLIPALYLLPAILYFITGYTQETTEYIEWNDEKIVVKPYGRKKKEYQRSELISLTISNNDLLITAPSASGTMVELDNYDPADIARLYENFGSAEIITQ